MLRITFYNTPKYKSDVSLFDLICLYAVKSIFQIINSHKTIAKKNQLKLIDCIIIGFCYKCPFFTSKQFLTINNICVQYPRAYTKFSFKKNLKIVQKYTQSQKKKFLSNCMFIVVTKVFKMKTKILGTCSIFIILFIWMCRQQMFFFFYISKYLYIYVFY